MHNYNYIVTRGSPLMDDKNALDIYYKRSITYDYFRFLKKKVLELAKENKLLQNNNGDKNKRYSKSNEKWIQEKLGDVIYWIYESKKFRCTWK